MSAVNNEVAAAAISRLRKDYMKLKKDPLPYISAEPLHNNILEWHYVIQGPPETPYFGGFYHGKLRFPAQFPFRPPAIFMITPNGRFKTNARLCLSMSDYHPDTWNPSWTVSTILAGLLSFMLEDTVTLGSMETTEDEKRLYAQRSLDFNATDVIFGDLFPEILEEIKQTITIRDLSRASTSIGDKTVSSSGSNHGRGQHSSKTKSILMINRFRRYIDFLRKKTGPKPKKKVQE